ncbi:hypothetical protein GCM10009846_15290 [Agrococcus versicolor]|uniref:Endolytic murein transglycosylase n=1 Tax=Agrococcus versicolor TaxID=501482 RepID=A0ABP5MK66_9MICO
MGRRGRPPGGPEGQEPEPYDGVADEAAARTPEPAEPPSRAPGSDQGAQPSFEEIFGAPTPTAATPAAPAPSRNGGRPASGDEQATPAHEAAASPVDALADAVGASPSQTPWATATSASAPATAQPTTKRERAPREPAAAKAAGGRRRGVRGGIVIIVVIVAILVGVVGGGWALLGPAIMDRFSEPEDFQGAGSGETVVRIEPGWTGAQVATMLEEEGVIADQEAFYELLVADDSIGFQPGSYSLALEMSAQSALDALQDPANLLVLQITIPEGFVVQQVYARLAEQSGLPESDFVQAASDASAYGVPGSTLEGWLFPATYTFEDGATAQQMLQAMVDRMEQALTDRGVPQERWQDVVTFASLVEREGGPVENFPQVARVFQNRLDIGMLLQSDATVHYGIGDFGVITTTDEERADANNPYNTYVYTGLPEGPIGAPGDAAIDAALSPAEGDWLYFVTIDPSTGETVFSETLAEHNQAVLLFQAWLRDNPEYGS